MKKTFNIFLLFLFSILVLTGCVKNDIITITSNTHDSNSTSKVKPKESIIRYYDESSISDDKLDLNIEVETFNLESNIQLLIKLNVINRNNKKVTFPYDKVSLVKLSDNQNYDVTIETEDEHENGNLILSKDVKSTVNYRSTIPLDISVEKYTFTIDSNKKYIFKLYETPINERETMTISYYLDSLPIKTVDIKKGLQATPLIYESEDFSLYCDEWYLNKSLTKKFDFNKKINENYKLYGTSKNIFEFNVSEDNEYYNLTKVNHVPSNNVLTIPNKYEEKLIYVSDSVLKDHEEIITLDLSKELKGIGKDNFVNLPNLKNINFDGNEAQWNEIINNTESIIPEEVTINFA